ncbi:MAG: DUF3429 domain-containing protein [Rhodovibrionaceae bacterium]|nr:DUF3429 domain-containing protein [Rhodovibrionaceae bacterium]
MLSQLPRPAVWLGFAGLLPFVATALAAWHPEPLVIVYAINLQLFYGACILSFLGAVHWGLALAGAGSQGDPRAAMTFNRLGWSVVPALLAWATLAMDPLVGLVGQIVGFAGMFFGDLAAVRRGYAPGWYLALRRPLTVIVILSLGSSLMRAILGTG